MSWHRETDLEVECAAWWQTLTPDERTRALEAAGERANVSQAFAVARRQALARIADAIALAASGRHENEKAIGET